MTVRLAIADLVTATGGRLLLPPGAQAPMSVSGVTTDSRSARPGDAFVALRGPRTDGHRFVADAMARGAVLAVVSDPSAAAGPAVVVADTLRALGALAALHRRTLPTTVVGITGSVGKTTTVGMCAQVLCERFVTARSAESWNAEIGVALTLLGLAPSHQVAVVEMAMRGLGQIRDLVEMARPRIGAVTTIGETHLELLGSREHIAAAKAELVEGLPADGVAIVNADEAASARLVRDARCRIVRFGMVPEADVRATEVRSSAEGCRFTLHVDREAAPARLPLVGLHQVRNALVAAAVGRALGLSLDEIVAGLARARVAKMRGEILTADDVILIDDSYNASPQSMAAAFEVLRQVGGARRRILALGEMRELGPASPAFHRQVGAQAAALAPALLVAVGEGARAYLDGAQAAGLSARAVVWVASAQEAIPIVRAAIRSGDVVLVKGSRAVEMEHVVGALRAREVTGGL
ncbi:MAG: UDP-N-acetylmuramoyl-tripeptide--D-alanyl-D-alanine ligase [Armatimonadota bacterium]|nr:UDP-N-acetylmuramoyl-tripeptide--D-alanyl-D-alanine ligase [Armatimonadota bacterium]